MKSNSSVFAEVICLLKMCVLALVFLMLWACSQDERAFTHEDLSGFQGVLEGEVINRRGELLPGVLVSVSPGGRTTLSDENGAFMMDGLQAGAYRVRYLRPEYLDTSATDSIVLGLLDTVAAPNVSMTYRFATLEGVVRDSSGNPLPMAGVSVEYQNANTQSMSEGRFAITKVEPGTLRIFAAREGVGYGFQDVQATPDTTINVNDLILNRAGGIVKGRVLQEDGSPLAHGDIRAIGGALKTTSDSAGNYRISTVPSESQVSLFAYVDDDPVASVSIQVGEGDSLVAPDIELGEPEKTEITVVPGTMLISDTAKSLNLQMTIVQDTMENNILPYWYEWSFDGGRTWDSTQTPQYRLEGTTWQDFRSDAFCNAEGKCRRDVLQRASTLEENVSVVAGVMRIVWQKSTYKIIVDSVGNGFIDANPINTNYLGFSSPDSSFVPSHTEFELTAIPMDGYEFIGWGGDVSGADNPLRIYVDSNMRIQGIFESTLVENDTLEPIQSDSNSSSSSSSSSEVPPNIIWDASLDTGLTAYNGPWWASGQSDYYLVSEGLTWDDAFQCNGYSWPSHYGLEYDVHPMDACFTGQSMRISIDLNPPRPATEWIYGLFGVTLYTPEIEPGVLDSVEGEFDARSYTGVSVKYSASSSFVLTASTSQDRTTDAEPHQVSMQSGANTLFIPWNSFTQPSWTAEQGLPQYDLEDYLHVLRYLGFKFEGMGTYDIEVFCIGFNDYCLE